MTARSFADTNIAIYTLDANPARRRAALSVMKARPVISVQVVNEFLKFQKSEGKSGHAQL
ncbi:MAG: hypothetical protein JZU52_13060 [Lamprocystis purpurea]|jgi:predicted nucleic acid-binding protein|uniref:hypothetical protein n=1 Tax=Lamprocystis purpurea TaxID=61598 RepID=UPI00036CEAF4|nr:hypothetical protein [Lamprocystis purpurea]MBV5274523.1 hypothetical protein [Lamprocystis purpurea]